MATTYVPVFLGAQITPNPAKVGEAILISIAAADVACVPYTQTWTAGELTAGDG